MANGTLAASQLEMLSQDGTGVTTIVPPATDTNRTLTLPDSTGTLSTMGVGTAVASTSGTSIDFTGIPSWAKKITVMFAGVSTNGTSITQIQLGDSGGFETSAYIGCALRADGSIAVSAYSSGYLMSNQAAADDVCSGTWVLSKLDGNTWVENHMLSEGADGCNIGGGYKALSDTLTQLRITTVSGTQTFDAGSINIMYEG